MTTENTGRVPPRGPRLWVILPGAALLVAAAVFRYWPREPPTQIPVNAYLVDEPLLDMSVAAGRAELGTTTKFDFPQFLGPQRNLIVAGISLSPDWATRPPQVVWKKPIGAGWSAFATVNGCAVTMEQRGELELVTCYEIETGELIWSYDHKARYGTLIGGIGPRSTPTIHDGKVYALGATGWLVCLDGATGKLIWKRALRAAPANPDGDIPFGRAGSPLIVHDLVVVPGGPDGQRTSLCAFCKTTGTPAWAAGVRLIGYSSPVLATLAGREQILNVTEAHVLGHDAGTGAVLWEFQWEGHNGADATSSNAVAIAPDMVLVTRGYGCGAALFRLVPAADGSCATEIIYHQRGVLRTKFTNVAVREGHGYALSEGVLECVRLQDGKRVWKSGRYGHGQVLLVGQHLLVLSETGELALVSAAPEPGEHELGRLPVLEGKTWNNLALHGEYLLLRNAREAACLRLALE